MAAAPKLTDMQIEEVSKVLGEYLSGTDITNHFTDMGITDNSGESTKWRRLSSTFKRYQANDRTPSKLLEFTKRLLEPSRYVNRQDVFEEARHAINSHLAFAGIEYRDDGKFAIISAAETIDEAHIDAAGFAAVTAEFGEEDWTQLRLVLSPSLTVRPIDSRVVAIWRSLVEGQEPPAELLLDSPASLLVWREGTKPVFRTATALEGNCLEQVGRGVSFGDLCASLAHSRPEAEAAAEAGAMLGRWLRDGLIVGLE